MNAPFWNRLEKAATVLLALCFAVPLALTAYFQSYPDKTPATAWLRNATLEGDRFADPEVPFSLDAIRRDTYQTAVAALFNHDFAGRELCLRLINEAYLRVFRTTKNQTVVGPGNWLVENDPPYDYVSEYCVERSDPDKWKELVGGLRRLQENCAQRGQACVLVITPSKAAVYPEKLPAAWLRRYDPRPRDYDNFVRLLRAAGVHFVDGARMTREMKARAGKNGEPTFRRSGIHWTDPAALPVANAVLDALAAQGQPVRALRDVTWTISDQSTYNSPDNDADMLDLCNLAFPWKDPVTVAHVHPFQVKESLQTTLVFIGGSFVGKLGRLLHASGQFTEIDWLRYYNHEKNLMVGAGMSWQVAPPPHRVDLATEVFSANNLVLEVNEQYIIHPSHLQSFLADALPRLPAPAAPVPVYRYESTQLYPTGGTLWFASGSPKADLRLFSGFSDPEPQGTWTDGTDAVMRLSLPESPGHAVRFQAELSAAVDPRLPGAHQHVDIFLNDEPVGAWDFSSPELTRREVSLPRDLLQHGLCILRFHIATPITPSPADPRRLGLCFVSANLDQKDALRKTVDFVGGPGHVDSRLLSGFSSNTEPLGTWNDERDASVRLIVPPLNEALHVRLVAVPILNPDLSPPSQRVSVFANGVPSADWKFTQASLATRDLFIPPDVVGSGGCVLRFHVENPVVPAEHGMSGDVRPLGLLFCNLQTNVPLETDLLHCDWGKGLSFVSKESAAVTFPGGFSGFSGAEPAGTWSDGPEVVARLLLPDDEGRDVVLRAELVPALDPARTPASQRVEVFVNDVLVGAWDFVSPEPTTREVRIPAHLVRAGRCVVRFHVVDPVSPANDGRHLGFFLVSLVPVQAADSDTK